MKDKVCLVTGANAGIGYATALGLAEMGATIVMVARDGERGAAAQANIRQQSGSHHVDLLLADLSVQAQIHSLAQAVRERYARLDVLLHNAAVIPLQRETTVAGLEMQFAVNHLAPFLLTHLLQDLLIASAPARVVTVSSMVHTWAGIDFDDLQNERGYDASEVYAQTKRMNVLFTAELARRLAGSGVTANCLHPGVIPTKLNINYMGGDRPSTASLASLRRGAETSIFLASSPVVAGVSGKYYANSRESDTAVLTETANARRLWQVSAQLTGLEK